MDKKQATKRAIELRRELQYHNYRYHVLQSPVVSDVEFDRLLAELRQIETEHPDLVTDDSPTQRVGESRSTSLSVSGIPHRFSA